MAVAAVDIAARAAGSAPVGVVDGTVCVAVHVLDFDFCFERQRLEPLHEQRFLVFDPLVHH